MTNESINILIVEDSQTQALRLKIILEEQGYRIAVGRNGREGLELIQKDFFPIVITDWIMPEMDGFEFCQTVRSMEFPGYVYIILLTAKDSRNDIIAGLEAGADDYLIKPVDEAELAARLNTAKRIINLEHSLRKRNEEIARLSITDPLTKTYNRRYLNEHLPATIKRASRYNHPLSVILCDIDHFKKVNDTYGHQAGDRVLEEFARCLRQFIRDDADWLARYGGEEFFIVLPETDLEGALKAAERFRVTISETPVLTDAGTIEITASFGAASVNFEKSQGIVGQRTGECLIAAADECLYRAKEEGRNRTFGKLISASVQEK